MFFEEVPNFEKKELITDEKAVKILKLEGITSKEFRLFLDQGQAEAEANFANANLANLEWAFRLAIVYHKAGLNKENELEDLEELCVAAYSSKEVALLEGLYEFAVFIGEDALSERINEMIKEIQTEDKSEG